MEIKYLVTSTGVWYEDDYICFCRIGEDEWGHQGYFSKIEVFKTITLIDNSVAKHSFAYHNAGAACVYAHRSFGYASLESAWAKTNHRLETVVSQWLPELITKSFS